MLARLPLLTRWASLAALALLLAAAPWLDGATLTMLAAGAILAVGIPHGGFDRLIAQGPLRLDRAGMLAAGGFALAYLAVAALVVLVWLWSPLIGLSGFLAISVLHFGLGDREAGPGAFQLVQVIAHGGLAAVLIPLAHGDAVTGLFAALSDPATAVTVAFALSTLAPFWGLAVAVYVVWALWRGGHAGRLLELAGLSAALTLLPPLLGFLLYFGALHGPRHMAATLAEVSARRAALRPVALELAVWSGAAYAMVAAAVFLVPGEAFETNLLRAVFIGLAALTVPHMLLVDGAKLIGGGRLAAG